MPIAEIKLRRGTTVDWLLVDPVLDAGEPGYDLTTKRIKVGDGTTPWSGLLFQTVDPATLTEMLGQVDDAVAAAEAAADTAADAAASVVREQPNGVAGLDPAGLLYPQRIPPSYERRVVAGADYAAEDAAAVTAGTSLVLAPGTHSITADLTIASPVRMASGAKFSVGTGVTLTLSGVVTAPPLTQVFTGTVKLSKAQVVSADWWGAKGTAAAPTDTIQRALDSTAPGTAIMLGGKYWTTPITVTANEDTLTGTGLSMALVGIASMGVRSQNAPGGGEWGAEIYLGNNQNADVLWLNGTQRGNAQPSRIGFLIDNVKINGNKAQNATGLAGFRCSFVKDVYIGRLLVENCKTRGMYVSAACNQIIGQQVEAMSNDSHGHDFASLGDSHFDILLGGVNGGTGTQLAGGTQVNQIHQYLNTGAGVLFNGDNCAVAMLRVNDNGQAGVVFSATSSNSWVGRCYSVDNGTDTGQTPAIRSGVRFAGAGYNNRIDVLSCPNAAGTQQYDIRFDTSLTGPNNTIGVYVGSGAVNATPVSYAATTPDRTNRVETVNGVATPPVAAVYTIASSATVTVNSDLYGRAKITAQAAALTIANPTGTPAAMQSLILRVKDNGTARTIAYGTQFRAIGITLPTTTVVSKTLYLGCIWNTEDTKWDVIAVAQEA